MKSIKDIFDEITERLGEEIYYSPYGDRQSFDFVNANETMRVEIELEGDMTFTEGTGIYNDILMNAEHHARAKALFLQGIKVYHVSVVDNERVCIFPFDLDGWDFNSSLFNINFFNA